MQLLFVINHPHSIDELLGMAQLSAAFGQDVHLWHPALLDQAQINACREAGISHISSAADDLHTWLGTCERLVRL